MTLIQFFFSTFHDMGLLAESLKDNSPKSIFADLFSVMRLWLIIWQERQPCDDNVLTSTPLYSKVGDAQLYYIVKVAAADLSYKVHFVTVLL